MYISWIHILIYLFTCIHTYRSDLTVADLAEVEADNLLDGEGISCSVRQVFIMCVCV